MKLIVKGSSSSGNAYILDAGNQYLLIEGGIPADVVMRSCKRQTHKVAGMLVSHIHGDHAKHLPEYICRGIKVYGNDSVAEAYRCNALEANKWYSIGDFKVMPFECKHDVPNCGYIIKHPDMHPLLFGTDTYAYPSVFRGIGNFLVEANYDDYILDNSSIDEAQRNRLMLSHMSIDYCVKYLHECKANLAQNIVLIHLSSRHSNERAFRRRIQQEFGVPCTIADKNIIVNLTKH